MESGLDQSSRGDFSEAPVKRAKSHVFAQHYVAKQTLLIPSMFVAFLFVWTIGWLYFGAVWGPMGKLDRLPVGVMVCDQGLPAQQAAVLKAAGILSPSSDSSVLSQVLLDSSIFNTSSPASQTLKWTAVPCTCSADTTGAGCISSMQDSLKNIGDYWAMLYVPHSFSASLMGWMTAAANSTAVRPTMTYMFPQGRHYSTYSAITKVVETVVQSISRSLAAQTAGSILKTPALAAQINPRSLVQPFELLEVNLSPVNNLGQSLWAYLVLILVYLGATYVASAKSPLQLSTESAVVKKLAEKGHTSVKRAQGIVLLVTNGFTSYLFELFLVVLLTCIWRALSDGSPDNQKMQFVGHNMGYAIAFLWYFSFSLIHVNHIFMHLVGDRFTALSSVFLILNLVSCGGVWPHELQSRFYKIGVALPFFYARQGLDTIFFGGFESRMALNWGVLTAWNVASAIVSLLLGMLKFKSRAQAQFKNMQQVYVDAGAAGPLGTPSVTAAGAEGDSPNDMASALSSVNLSLPLPPMLSGNGQQADGTHQQRHNGPKGAGEVEEQVGIGKYVGQVALMGA